MSLYQGILITTSLLALFSFASGVFSLVRNPKSKIVVSWFLASMAVTIWSVGYLLVLTSESLELTLNSFRIVYFGASLIPALTFNFIVHFLYQEKKYKYLTYGGCFLAVVFAVLTTLTPFIIKGTRFLENFGHYEEIVAPGFYFFLLYFLSFPLIGVILLLRAYFQSDGIRKRQLFFVTLALLVGFSGGISNFITDLTGVYPYGQMIVWLYPVLVTYGIFVDEFKFKLKF